MIPCWAEGVTSTLTVSLIACGQQTEQNYNSGEIFSIKILSQNGVFKSSSFHQNLEQRGWGLYSVLEMKFWDLFYEI